MSLLEEIKAKYQEQKNNATENDKLKILDEINKAVEQYASVCTIRELENISLARNWLQAEGFSAEIIQDYRNGNYILISGWDN